MKKELSINQIVCGDCLEVMEKFPDKSIDMCMTSPPYWGLRDYGVEQIFGGDKNCEHEWNEHSRYWDNRAGSLLAKEGTADFAGKKDARGQMKTNVCSKCHAWKGQLGLEPTPELYIEHMAEIFNEVKRVLKKEGTFWLNISDTYGGSGGAGGDYNSGGLREGQSRYKQGETKLPPKCLCMIPERLAWSLIQNGWILRNKNIWHKRNSMPSSVKDRFSNTYEFVYCFVKSNSPVYWTNRKTLQLVVKQPLGIKGIEGADWEWREIGEEDEQKKVSFWTGHDYYFDLDAVREPHLPQSITRAQGHDYTSGPWAIPGGVNGEHGRIHELGKNPGDVFEIGAETRTMGAIIGQGGGVKVPGGQGWTGHPKGGGAACQKDPRWCPPEGKNPGDFWNIATQPFPEAHFAVFPEKLCEKPIKVGCPEQVCKKCRKARERIIKHKSNYAKRERAHAPKSEPSKIDSTGWNPPDIEQLGWASCDCNAGFEGGIVLDPFCGAGTALYVAKEMKRRFIGIDVKQEYCEMAEKRLAQGVL